MLPACITGQGTNTRVPGSYVRRHEAPCYPAPREGHIDIDACSYHDSSIVRLYYSTFYIECQGLFIYILDIYTPGSTTLYHRSQAKGV